MRAFRGAAEVGSDLIELDVHLSRDDVPVVIHDDTLDRTTDARGLVRERGLEELRRLDAGKGERIPTLEEVVAWAAAGDIALSVEIKQPSPVNGRVPYEGIAERVVEALRGAGVTCLIHSFDHPTIRRARELWPDAATAVSYGSGALVDPLGLGRSADASGIHPWWTAVSPALCAAAHAAGMHVHGWGATWPPKREEVEALVRAGVDSLDANDPRELRRILDAVWPPTTAA